MIQLLSRRACRGVCAILLMTLAAQGRAEESGKAQRVVSLSVCSDQLLLDLVPRGRIAALSYLATDPTLSSKVAEAKGLPVVVGGAEEVLRLAPDLVIAQEYSMMATVELLQRLGIRVLRVPLAANIEGMRQSIRLMAAAVDEKARGERLIADFDARITAVRPIGSDRPSALAYEVSSLASGDGTLVDSMLDAAGFRNVARGSELGPGGRLPLEKLVTDPPDLIVMANQPNEFRSVVGDNLRHPAFTIVAARKHRLALPMPYWLCPTPKIADAIEKLARIRQEIIGSRAP
jgi:iron complex transport system substrate-binding protein